MGHITVFSRSAEYGIQAAVYLASKDTDSPVMVREIANAYGIPKQFLSKIVRTLVQHHIFRAVRGRRGGIRLARRASEIRLPQIIHAIDGPPPQENRCFFGLDACADSEPCPFHFQWKPIRDQIGNLLGGETLASVAKRVDQKHERMGKRKGRMRNP